MSVSLSSDGNTAIVGGSGDDNSKGAAWVFTRSHQLTQNNGVSAVWIWTQQKKLVGAKAIGPARQGFSVSLSSDGNTAIVGGPWDDDAKGAAWVFTRSHKLFESKGLKGPVWIWSQQKKLVDTEAIAGYPNQGQSVSLSSDGNTAIVSGPGYPDYQGHEHGAAWVYTRSGGVWTQESKLFGTGYSYGQSVSLSSDGNTAIVGVPLDDNAMGAAWVYVREKHPEEPWWKKYVAIDPMALILEGKALDIWYEIHHPHEPKVAEIQQVLRSMTPEEQKATLNRARNLANDAKAEEKMLRSLPPEEQKAALNRARTLANYAKAVEEAVATMKK
jgi:hypothetical protein